jgi:transcriptional regulator of acetoin/glycerol metabolism
MRRCEGNISQAAESLGLSRAALYRRIEKYGL